MITEKLYDKDAYLKEFEATVVASSFENGKYYIELDKTVFFPEEGGQSCDKGTLNGLEVIHVSVKNGTILHELAENIEVGVPVYGKIDSKHRFFNMQMHSGEHIFSGLAYSTYAANNVGFHLSDNSATIDLDKKISFEEAQTLETRVNEIIVENRNIIARYPDPEELKRTSYRSKKELAGPVRLVTVEGVDTCACCAPHVRSTAEVGFFKIESFENYKAGVRIHYLCGFRALFDYREKLSNLSKISRLLSVKAGFETEGVQKLFDDFRSLSYENQGLKLKLIEKSITGSILFLEPKYSSLMKNASDMLKERFKGTTYVFAGNDENGYRYLIESDSEDLTVLSGKMKSTLGAKGGGRSDCIQGSLKASKEEINKLIEC